MAHPRYKKKKEKKLRTGFQNTVETAATLYFGFCRRAALVISNTKRKKSKD